MFANAAEAAANAAIAADAAASKASADQQLHADQQLQKLLDTLRPPAPPAAGSGAVAGAPSSTIVAVQDAAAIVSHVSGNQGVPAAPKAYHNADAVMVRLPADRSGLQEVDLTRKRHSPQALDRKPTDEAPPGAVGNHKSRLVDEDEPLPTDGVLPSISAPVDGHTI